MEIKTGTDGVFNLVCHQLSNLFLMETDERKRVHDAFETTLARVDACFSASTNKYYRSADQVLFSPYHSGQYCIFLYYLANTAFQSGGHQPSVVCDKLYMLNKALNGLDLYYEVAMPDVFFLDHPVGSVMGRAQYGDGFSFSQNCTVGNNKGRYPTIGRNVKMMSGSKILGGATIGDGAIISANAYVKGQDVPPNSIVFGSSPNLIFKPKS